MIHKFPLLVLAAVILGGCALEGEYISPYVHDIRSDRGLVIVLPGIEGRSPLNEAICDGLVDGGVQWAVDLIDWTSPVPMNYLMNLRDQARNRSKAEEIAHRIIRYKMAYPGRPVVLVGQSGGGGMAVWVAEALPADERIDGIIMLAAALSPDYSLDTALAKCDRGIISFYSSNDWFILGVGTTISGTMDGEHTSSAGRVGFYPPLARQSAELYARKLFQIPWQPEMADVGYTGTHLTSGARTFVAQYVAPFVQSQRWDLQYVQAVLGGRAEMPTSAPATRRTVPPVSEPTGPPPQRPARTPPLHSLPALAPAERTGPPVSPPSLP